ncbi:uncharacterized protein PWA37_001152 [Arxiozyma heterogenica]|uniref:uncharacterized protein n=1 Tax=Arxiozyma heterogenica TaxID=278026 RepID=UPI002F2150FE
MKGLVFNNPIEGEGEVTGTKGAIIFFNTDIIGRQTFSVNENMYIINPKVVPSSFKVVNIIGSDFVFLDIDFQTWSSKNTGTLKNIGQLNYALYGHRYWLNRICTFSWTQTYVSNIRIITSDPLYKFNGTSIFVSGHEDQECSSLSEPITKTTSVTTMDSITKAITISTLTTSTRNQYFHTVPEFIYQVAVPPLSTISTTFATLVTTSTSITYTTTVTDTAGSVTEEIVVVVQTPPLSTSYTTITYPVTAQPHPHSQQLLPIQLDLKLKKLLLLFSPHLHPLPTPLLLVDSHFQKHLPIPPHLLTTMVLHPQKLLWLLSPRLHSLSTPLLLRTSRNQLILPTLPQFLIFKALHLQKLLWFISTHLDLPLTPFLLQMLQNQPHLPTQPPSLTATAPLLPKLLWSHLLHPPPTLQLQV